MAESGTAKGAPPLMARAHHGSVSKEQRARVEEDLKAGRLPAVVATSSLELGIDMGAVDLVIQVESPPSVASGLQRVGRAGHQVGAVSTGVVFPKYRGDLVQAAVVTERMRTGSIEALRIPANPLDVLAQQLVATVALDTWQADDLLALARRAAPFASLPESAFTAVLDMLAGRYPSDAFAELRPRVVWDRVTGTVTGRPGAQRLAVTSGGTIPDRGLFGVFLAGSSGAGSTNGRSRGGGRVGELDEEMVYESRVGDVFTLGTTSWRIEDITRDQVLVSPAPGVPGRLPSGKATSWAVRSSWAARWGRSCARWERCPKRTAGCGWWPPASTPGRRTMSWRIWTSSAAPAAMSPTTGRSSWSGSGTSWATGGSSSTPRSVPRCTRPGRWPSAPGSPSGTGWTPRSCTPTTASCCGCPTPIC